MNKSWMILPAFVMVACSVENAPNLFSGPETNVTPNSLMINEYSPKSNVLSEFDEPADWIELYNPANTEMRIEDGEFSITDDRANPGRFFLPAATIPPFGHLVIWCDDKDTVARDIHAGFKLSGSGEEICLFRRDVLVDEIYFEDDVKKGMSYGRVEDGAAEWIGFSSPSPGSSNQSADNYAETIK
jgi:hypothetical protein